MVCSRIWFFMVVVVVAISRITSAQTVPLTIEDYLEVGGVREAVRSGYEELANARLDLRASIDYADVVATVVSGTGDLLNISNAATAAATLYGTVDDLADSVNAENIAGLSNALSLIDTGPIFTTLSNLEARVRTLNLQTSDPILPPTFLTCYAAIVSSSGRTAVEQMRADAVAGRASMLRALDNAIALDVALQRYRIQLQANRQRLQDLQRRLAPMLEIWGIGYLYVQPMLLTAINLENSIIFLSPQVSQLIEQLDAVERRLQERIGEADLLVEGLDSVLSNCRPLISNWSTTADVGGQNAFFVLSFAGRDFAHPFTEIDGRFLLGTLTITNLITPGGGDVSTNASIAFGATRRVQDPVLGTRITSASTILSMNYFASLNGPDNCGNSRDYFAIPDLGVRIYICETRSRSFAVYGQYDSPLRIVAVEPLPDDIDPDPAADNFAYTLHVTDGEGSGVFVTGQQVTVRAVPPPGRQFVRWDGDRHLLADASAQTSVVTMPASNASLVAISEPLPRFFQLNVVDGLGTGLYREGTEVGIRATPASGRVFSGWAGDIATVFNPASATTTVRVDQNINLGALTIPQDDCPTDPNKTLPGHCGCGRPDVDSDGDGLLDCIDACANSNLTPSIDIDGCETGVPNRPLAGGCTMSDEIRKAARAARNHGDFVSDVARMTASWQRMGLLTGAQKGSIGRCAAQAALP